MMTSPQRKIIHIDMDCFYAAVEIRDNPKLHNLPVAVGGSSENRGVLCTCNYIAREYGVRSAMPTAYAYKLCKNLVVIPVNMEKYRNIAKQIRSIFFNYTNLVEPLALDEAYLDVSNTRDHAGSATLIAEAIRQQIWEQNHITASAGVSVNKFLAKVASKRNKPNGIFVLPPIEIDAFLRDLPVSELFGVGRVTEEKLRNFNLITCHDLQQQSYNFLTKNFGKLGVQLYNQCRGIDVRPVNPSRERKSLSVETTVIKDIVNLAETIQLLHQLYNKLLIRLEQNHTSQEIKGYFIKFKFSNFKVVTSEVSATKFGQAEFIELVQAIYYKYQLPVRLLGIGVNFKSFLAHAIENSQLTLF